MFKRKFELDIKQRLLRVNVIKLKTNILVDKKLN